jgi:hypothetical protein
MHSLGKPWAFFAAYSHFFCFSYVEYLAGSTSWIAYVASYERIDNPIATGVILNSKFVLTSSRPRGIQEFRLVVSW